MKILKVVIFIASLVIAYIFHFYCTARYGNFYGFNHHGDSGQGAGGRQHSVQDLENQLWNVRGREPSWLIKWYGEHCYIAETAFEVSGISPGNIVNIELLSKEADDTGKIPVKVTLSAGSGEEIPKLKNLIDPEEWFEGTEKKYTVGEGFTVSYNEFYTGGGKKCRVWLYSDEFSDGVFTGEQYITVKSGSSEALHMEEKEGSPVYYDGHFALQLEDYGGNGSVGFCFRVGAPEEDGAYYRMIVVDRYGDAEFRAHDMKDPKAPVKGSFFVYGETAPSVRLDIIDRDTYFFMTKDSDGLPVSSIWSKSSGDSRKEEDFSNGNLIFSSRYEEGCIKLKVTNVWVGDNRQPAVFSLKRLNGMLWESIPLENNETEIKLEAFASETFTIPVELEKGVYAIEADLGGEITATEFYVR